MNPERWERIKELFGEALEHEPSSRQAFLRQACPDDEMYEEVVTLVAAQADGDLLRLPISLFPGSLRRSWQKAPCLRIATRSEKK